MKKSDLVIPELQPNIEIGSQVVFVDGSFTMSLINGKYIHTTLGVSDDIFTVIAINVPCPSEECDDALGYSNNCIVYNPIDNSYHFCSRINIRSIRKLGSDIPYVLK